MAVDFMKDFLFPDEVIKFRSKQPMKFANGRYMIYLTNQRLIAHRRRGLLVKKDDVIAERLELKRLEAEMVAKNTASVRLAEKFGFKREGTKRKAFLSDDEKYLNTYIYGKLL